MLCATILYPCCSDCIATRKGNCMKLEDIDISPELREKAKECTSPEELLALAKKEGYKLSEAEIEAVSGGGWSGCSTDVWYGTGAV